VSEATDLLQVDDLHVEFRARRHVVHAVSGVSLALNAGQTVGLVGESGSGKTTLGRAILGLVRVSAGTVRLRGTDITSTDRRGITGEMQAVFQDPYGSLNPAVKIGRSLVEAARGNVTRAAAQKRMIELLDRVGLPAKAVHEYPGRFSGGQRQRIAVARALMAAPSLVVCDEPVSALDVSIQAQVLNLLRDLQQEMHLSYLFIGHDLDVVRFMADRIVVMNRGVVLEEGPASVVASTPRSPYTQALLAASPTIKPGQGALTAPPTTAPAHHPELGGCPFAGRCAYASEVCRSAMPRLHAAPGGGAVACHHFEAQRIQEQR